MEESAIYILRIKYENGGSKILWNFEQILSYCRASLSNRRCFFLSFFYYSIAEFCTCFVGGTSRNKNITAHLNSRDGIERNEQYEGSTSTHADDFPLNSGFQLAIHNKIFPFIRYNVTLVSTIF